MLQALKTMNKKLEENLFMEWFLEDDEPQEPKKVKVTPNLKKAIEKLQAPAEEPKKHMSLLEILLAECSGTACLNRKYNCIDNIKKSLNNSTELVAYLKKRQLYSFYILLIDYAESHISFESLSNNGDAIVFFNNKNAIADMMHERKIPNEDDINEKLNSLAELGLIKSLTDDEIRADALERANDIKDQMSEQSNKIVYRTNFYMIYDLTEDVVSEALRRISLFKKFGVKRKDVNAITRSIVLGEDVVKNNITVQKQFEINPTKKKHFITAANELLSKQQYFTEEQLRKAYCKKDHNISKSEAIKLTTVYILLVVKELGLKRVRVNKNNKKEYNLSKNIKSNTYIYMEDK